MRPARRGVVIASLGPSGLPAFLIDDLFAFANTFDMRGSFPFSHKMPPFFLVLPRNLPAVNKL